jgi:membrane protein required for colicin V production
MVIDIIFIILILAAVIRGTQRGLIVAVFSFIACVAGLAAAVKLSAVLAIYMENHYQLSSKWVPIFSFLLIFLAVVLAVRWIADFVDSVVDMVLMQWLNRLGGAALYLVLFISVYSVILFYGTRSGIITQHAIRGSFSYRFVEPWGPAILSKIGAVIPFFRNMFLQLEDFFSRLASR